MSRALCCDKYCACMLKNYTVANQATILLPVYWERKPKYISTSLFVITPDSVKLEKSRYQINKYKMDYATAYLNVILYHKNLAIFEKVKASIGLSET